MSTQIDLGPVLSIPKGDWNATTTYERLNIVRHNSASWICNVATSKGVEPTEDSADWYLQVKDTSSVTSVNGMKGDVVIELTETETPPADDNSNRIATTEWVTDKLGDVDLSGIKEDTVLAAQNASSLEVGTGELTSAELAVIIENNDTALRALIAKEVAKYLPLAGGTMGGSILFAPAEFSGLNAIASKSHSRGYLQFCGGTGYSAGASLALYGRYHDADPAAFILRSASGEKVASLRGDSSGKLTWAGKDVITSDGGTMTGQLFVSDTADFIRRDVNNDRLVFLGGPHWESCSYIELFGGDNTGRVQINARDGRNYSYLELHPNGGVFINGSPLLSGNNVACAMGQHAFYNCTKVGTTGDVYARLPDGGTWRYITSDDNCGQVSGGSQIQVNYEDEGRYSRRSMLAIRIA